MRLQKECRVDIIHCKKTILGAYCSYIRKRYSTITKLHSYMVAILFLLLVLYVSWKATRRRLNKKYAVSRRKRSISLTDENSDKHSDVASPMTTTNNIHKTIVHLIQADRIRNISRHYTSLPHEPGSQRNERLGREMAERWKQYGLDKTEIFKYNVLLSFPRKQAEIQLIENSRLRKKIIVSSEPAYGLTEKNGNVSYPYFAFTTSGNISAPVVYVNYGTRDDYAELRRSNIVTKGRIFLVRNGAPDTRPAIINRAIKHGALAVLYYSDPTDFSLSGDEYPRGGTMNEFGVTRRNIGTRTSFNGDLLSIGYPSKLHYYREKVSHKKHYLYPIPLQPISASTATDIFNFMVDNPTHVPSRFKGALKTAYALHSGEGKNMSLNIENKLEDHTSSVVCGTLFGSTEPDRYIIIGNHRDAWGYGASDPGSGSSVMSEMIRVLCEYKNTRKYRPRRSLMVCSWGAEEMGLLGSTEWADENSKFITHNAVAYLNVDVAVEGNFTVKIKSTDQMAQSILDAARQVPSPGNSNITLYQDMRKKHAKLKGRRKDLKTPEYNSPGVMSDNSQFSNRYGKAVSDYRYTYDQLVLPKSEHAGQYHTMYDSFDWMNTFVDRTFQYHVTLGKLWLTHALFLLDSVLLPFDLKHYVERMEINFLQLEKEYNSTLIKHNVTLEFAKERVRNLREEVTRFQNIIRKLKIEKLTFNNVRAINDVIMNFGQQFMLKSDMRFFKQVYDSSNSFAGIRNSITENPGENWDNVRKEITLFVWCVDMATKSLDLSELRVTS